MINLGPPIAGGTSIIMDKVISMRDVSDGVGSELDVDLPASRDLRGQRSAQPLPGQRDRLCNPSPGRRCRRSLLPATASSSFLPGGTYLVSDASAAAGVTTGQIGDIRIGGNVTNFTAFALDTDLLTFPLGRSGNGPQVSNFFIGGETNNVILVAPAGSRNVYFGRGMDNTFINTAFIQNLQANRGAVGSAVTVKRTIGNMVLGGDLTNSFIQSGYDQELSAVANQPATTIAGFAVPAAGVFNGQAPPTIQNRIQNTPELQTTFSPLAHGGGFIHGRIAGNVTNSIVSVSVDPDPSGINTSGSVPDHHQQHLPVWIAQQHRAAAWRIEPEG